MRFYFLNQIDEWYFSHFPFVLFVTTMPCFVTHCGRCRIRIKTTRNVCRILFSLDLYICLNISKDESNWKRHDSKEESKLIKYFEIYSTTNYNYTFYKVIQMHFENLFSFFFFSGLTRNGPNRSVKPKKGTKKGGSIWPANLNLGFFNKNNKKKNKRPPVKQKSPIPASKRPPTLSNNSIKVTLRNTRKCMPRI